MINHIAVIASDLESFYAFIYKHFPNVVDYTTRITDDIMVCIDRRNTIDLVYVCYKVSNINDATARKYDIVKLSAYGLPRNHADIIYTIDMRNDAMKDDKYKPLEERVNKQSIIDWTTLKRVVDNTLLDEQERNHPFFKI